MTNDEKTGKLGLEHTLENYVELCRPASPFNKLTEYKNQVVLIRRLFAVTNLRVEDVCVAEFQQANFLVLTIKHGDIVYIQRVCVVNCTMMDAKQLCSSIKHLYRTLFLFGALFIWDDCCHVMLQTAMFPRTAFSFIPNFPLTGTNAWWPDT